MKDRVEFLKSVTPFNLLPQDLLAGVAELLQEVRHPKDSVIYHQ